MVNFFVYVSYTHIPMQIAGRDFDDMLDTLARVYPHTVPYIVSIQNNN